MSDVVEAGRRWGRDIDAELSVTDFGIVCLTQENLEAPWILFEAEAIAKRVEQDARLVPYLIDDINPGYVKAPLGLFQVKRSDEKGTRELMNSINSALVSPLEKDRLDRVFDDSWHRLQKDLRDIPPSVRIPKVERSQEDILLEVLDTVRNLATRLDLPSTSSPVSTEADCQALRTQLLKRREADLEMVKWADIFAQINDWQKPTDGEEEPEKP